MPSGLVPNERSPQFEVTCPARRESRRRVSGPIVKEPRHFLLYRRRSDGVLEIARVLDEARDFQRHLPEDYRSDPAAE